MQTLTVKTKSRTDLRDITHDVAEAVAKAGVETGAVMISVPHTTAGITPTRRCARTSPRPSTAWSRGTGPTRTLKATRRHTSRPRWWGTRACSPSSAGASSSGRGRASTSASSTARGRGSAMCRCCRDDGLSDQLHAGVPVQNVTLAARSSGFGERLPRTGRRLTGGGDRMLPGGREPCQHRSTCKCSQGRRPSYICVL